MPVTVIMIRITVAGILLYPESAIHDCDLDFRSCRSTTSVCRPEKRYLKNVGRWVGFRKIPSGLRR